MLDSKDIRKVSKFADYLDCVVEDIEKSEEVIKNYFSGMDLASVLSKMKNDVNESVKRLHEGYTWLRKGEVIKISSGDGISFHQDDYLEIVEVTRLGKVFVNQVTVLFGDYGNSLQYDSERSYTREEILKWFEGNHHNVDTSENKPKFEKYKKIISEIPEL